jgi:hypothetical protein
MDHHLRLRGYRLGRCWWTRKVYGSSGGAREETFIKGSMAGDDEALIHWVPEFPSFDTCRIAHKDASPGMRLQCLPFAFAH